MLRPFICLFSLFIPFYSSLPKNRSSNFIIKKYIILSSVELRQLSTARLGHEAHCHNLDFLTLMCE